MAYAPDKHDPFPKPKVKPKPKTSGNVNAVPNVLGPGGVKNLAKDMAAEFGGTVNAWKKDIRTPYRHDFNWGRGGGKGGKNDKGGKHNGDNGPGVVLPGPWGTDRDYPAGDQPLPRRPAQAMQQIAKPGFLQPTPPLTQAPTAGLFAQQQPVQRKQTLQPQLPPEIIAMMRNRMGR